MYRFQIIAHTQTGDCIGLVGSSPELGEWDVSKCVRLQTRAGLYPLWQTELNLELQSCSSKNRQIEYKYVRLDAQGQVQWEAWGPNRWVPIDPEMASDPIVVDDGAFGYLQPYPFSYRERPAQPRFQPDKLAGLKILVIGSSVALGHKAWLLNGWAERLGADLAQKYGHQLVNVSEVGANVTRTIARFDAVVSPHQPDVIIIALSLGNEGLAYCPAHDRKTIQRRFEHGLHQLIKMSWERGAYPILGGVYPHADYDPDHYDCLQETHHRMLNWGVPLLDWLTVLEDGQGRWKPGISFDPAHPNTIGHQLMHGAINLQVFDLSKSDLNQCHLMQSQPVYQSLYHDAAGFQVSVAPVQQHIRLGNPTPYCYDITPAWSDLQVTLHRKTGLTPGVYLTTATEAGVSTSLAVARDGTIASPLTIPARTELDYTTAFNYFSDGHPKIFQDGQLGIFQQNEQVLWVLNESDHEYNLHPMWQEVRRALKAMPEGVYHDPLQPDAPFRTLMIGPDGLESRVKVLPQSALRLQYQGSLSAIQRVAILPLGDRCAVRMMLYRMGYDGPAFPFDLTRTTQISDVADLIENRFADMWNPAYLDYSPEAGRIYHRKWSGLSFAHEVEDSDQPTQDMSPVYQRMHDRYSARSARFWYTLEHCDQVLFVRTGIADRNGVIDLVDKLQKHCRTKPFKVLLLSPQSSDEFAGLPHVLHYNQEFNPDRMYADLEHWQYCTEILRKILEDLGISSKNLFWCPPKIKA